MSGVRIGTSYLSEAFGDSEYLIENARDNLGGVKFDTMVGTGLSGSLVVPILARAFDCRWLIVRKDEKRHSMYDAEGWLGDRWLFVDDLIDSGATYRRVRTKVRALADSYAHKTQFVGAYLYTAGGFYGPRSGYLAVGGNT